jgi:short-subunit dehydrogenase
MLKGYRTAIITGTSHGIGPHIAKRLADEGLNLVLAARTSKELEKVASEVGSTGAQVIAIPTDVTDSQALNDLVYAAEKAFGPIDVLVNNAGGDPQREFHNYAQSELDAIIRLNLTSVIELTRLLLPHMLEGQHGHIVNISSMGGWMGFPHTEVYSACKNGVAAFSRVLRADYGRMGIGASTLILGSIGDAGHTPRTMSETGFQMPAMGKFFFTPADSVAKAVVAAIKHNKAEIVIMPGPGRLMKAQMDFFPGMGPMMNRMVGLTDLMKQIADYREVQARKS